jgi:TRAP-type C4-dicarboxylate transport system permease small subunit
MSYIRAFSDFLGKILEALIVILISVMTVLMFAQVLGRYVFKNGLYWAEELSRFSMVYLVYLGAAIASKNHDHISVTILDELLQKKAGYTLYRTLIALINLAFLAIVSIIGLKSLAMVRAQTSPNMGIPMSIAYAAIPIGSILMMLYVILELVLLYAPAEGGKA